jgi:O-antigen biosynthesis protein
MLDAHHSREAGRFLPVRAVVDVAAIDGAGNFRLSGWALAPRPIVAVEVHDPHRRLGTATYGLARPDVAALNSGYPRAASSGFAFFLGGCRSLPSPIELRILEEDGRTTRLEVEPGSGAVTERAPASSIRLHVDRAFCDTQGQLTVEGWAFAPDGLEQVVVSTFEQTLGTTVCDISRPDVHAAMPQAVTHDRTGFRFTSTLDEVPVEPLELMVRALAADQSSEMRVVAEIGILAITSPTQDLKSDAAFRLFVDSPEATAGVARQIARGRIEVNGWALARDGVDRVDVLMDEVLLGHAYYGTVRPDLQQAFPDWPGAARSGFAYVIPTRVLKNGAHILRVVVVDREGATQSHEIRIEVDLSDAQDVRSRVRERVPYAETSLRLRSLADAGALPHFTLLIRLRRGWREGLERTLRSVRLQTYGNWNISLVHEFQHSELAQLREVIAHQPPEIRQRIDLRAEGALTWRTRATNSACPLVMTLAPGDILAADALMHFAAERASGSHDFIYSDDRRWSIAEGRYQAFFKPDWSPETLLAFNYIGKAWVADLAIIKRCFEALGELLRVSDYEQVLRLTEICAGVGRVPRLLMDTAGQGESSRSQQVALKSALRRRGEQAKVTEGAASGTFRVMRALRKKGRVSIIVPTIAAQGLVSNCIESIRKVSTYRDFEIVLLDNIRKPDRKWKPWFKRNADKVVAIDESFNWSRFNNIGRQHATGDYLLFLNDDIEVIEPGWLEAMLVLVQRDDVGVVGPQLLYPDGKVQHAGMFLARDGVARHAFRFSGKDDAGYFGLARTQRNVSAVTGACMMVRAEVFDRLGGFDERHDVVNNDLDFCLRAIRAGLQVVYTPHARLYHHEQVSRAELRDSYNSEAFMNEWGRTFLRGDPFFNPNLSLDSDDFAFENEPVEEVYAGYPVADAKGIRRILVVKLDHIGDFVTAVPAIRRLKQVFPHASISVLVGPSVAPLARSERAVDDVHVFSFFHVRSGLGQVGVSVEDLHELRERLGPIGFDLAIDLRKHPDSREVLRFTGAPLTAGFDSDGKFPWLDIATEWEGDRRFENKRMHVAGDLLTLVSAVEIACREDRGELSRGVPRKALPDAIRKIAPELYRRPVVCVHPASGSEMRQWPTAYFSQLIDLLISEMAVHVLVIGSPDEAELAKQVLEGVKSSAGVWSAVGAFKLSELPTVLRSCSLFVGNNSGPQHVAATSGVPTVAVHSDVISSEEWGPLGPVAVALRRNMECGPCYLAHREHCHRALACMTGIEPRRVLLACSEILKGISGASSKVDSPLEIRRRT